MSALHVKQDGPLSLKGQKCLRCGRVSFPSNPYGCESCGAFGPDIEDELLVGRGVILAFVTVNRAIRPNVGVPYTVISVALEGGPVIRALIADPADTDLQVGDAVEAELVAPATPEQGEAQQVRFRRMERI